MPWCPKCRRFQEEDDLCKYCWVEVVDTLPFEQHEQAESENEVLLVSVGDENEANIIQNLLEVNQIPSLRRYRDIGGYMKVYMGTSSFGIDIFVPESCMDTARQILITDTSNIQEESGEDEPTLNYDKPQERKNIARFLLMFILIPLVCGLLIYAFELLLTWYRK